MGQQGRQLEFRLLGPLEVLDGGAPLPLGPPKERALLALLLVHAGTVVPLDRVAEELWGERQPKNAQTSVHVYVSHLRKLLEPERGRGEKASLLTSGASGYSLDLQPGRLDAERFEQLAAEGGAALAAGDVAAAAPVLHEALALWRGPALADFRYEPFAQSEIARLEELRLACTEDRIDADLAGGLHAPLVGELEALIHEHPLRERLRGLRMLALYRSGRQAEALEAYADARQTLVDELGIEPGPALQALHRSILNQDPALELPRPARPVAASTELAAPIGPEQEAAEPLAAPETRKVVTVVRAGLVDEGELAERLDPELFRRVLRSYAAAATTAIERHGGTVEAPGGAAVVGVFGIPRANEDDALRAVRAALDLRDAVAAVGRELEGVLGQPLSARVALHTGEVVAGDPAAAPGALTGDVPGTAAQLEEAAGRDEVLITDSTRRLVQAAVRVDGMRSIPLRGRTAPVKAWRLVELADTTSEPAAPVETPFVGRGHELEQLRQAFARAVRERTLVLFTVLGTAGVGKSRLTRELLAAVEGEASVLVGRCVSYGEGITFLPLRELVHQATGGEPGRLGELLGDADDRDVVAERIAGLVGLEETDGTSEESFEAVRRFVEALAREQPLVLVFEDIHWAEPTFLDVLDHLADWMHDAPVLLLCLARPDLLDARPTWGGGKANAVALRLEPLDQTAAESLIEGLPGAAVLDVVTRARVAEAAEGNPLFIEQMLALAAEGGAGAGDVAVPATIHAILAARLDRLGPAERAVIERGALIGREFRVDAVQELAPDGLRATVEQHLLTLVRRELVRRAPSSPGGRAEFRFRHSLIRDAAYNAMPKERRAELHERFADWLERSGEPGGLPELVGHHLEQAHRYRAELGLVGPETEALARRAADVLGAAGHGAFSRGDIAGAANLLERAVSLAADAGVDDLIGLAEALQGLGRLERAEAVMADAAAAAERAGDRGAAASIALDRLDLRALVDPDLSVDEVRAAAEDALLVFGELDDRRGLARAWRAVAEVHLTLCEWERTADALQRALDYAEQEGVDPEVAACRTMLATALYYGPTPVSEARRRCEELLAQAGHPVVEGNVLCYLGGLAALEGSFDEARELHGRGRRIFEELEHPVGVAGSTTVSGPIELLAGDAAAAERELRAGYETFKEMGEIGILSTLAALLAEAVLAQGRDAEAEELTLVSERAAAADDAASQVAWRTVRAGALARRGDVEGAERLARDAVERAAATDFLALHASALSALAEALDAGGDAAGAAESRAEAGRLVAAKGIRVGPHAS